MGWRRYLSRAARDRERADEIRTHLELYVEELVARGRSREVAERQARVAFGNARVKQEEVDHMNRLPILDVLGRDVRYAFRVLRRAPAFTATAIVTLALVIGANTAVFSLADAILVRPLPYPHPERLAVVTTIQRGPRGQGDPQTGQTGASWEALRDEATSVDVALQAGSFGSGVNLVVDHVAATVSQARVSAGYFRVLGLAPFLGREFTRDEDRPGGPAVAILSYGLWQRLLEGAPDVVGRTLMLRGETYEIVGVMPKLVDPFDAGKDLWTPARPSRTGEGGGENYEVIARVKDGHTWAQANEELRSVGLRSFADRYAARRITGYTAWWSLMPLQDYLVDGLDQPIEMLSGAVGIVLLIACVNLAVLLVARSGSRTKEIATRMALGSGRLAVVRQLVVESVVLAACGGALGVVVGYLGLEALKTLGGQTFTEWKHVTLDARVLVVTAGLSILTGLVFGLVPALQASRLDVNRALSEGGSRGVAGRAGHWAQRVLVAAEVALGVVLLVAAGLLIRTLLNLSSLDPGFNPRGVTTGEVSLQDARYKTSAQVNQLFDNAVAELARTPGVVSAAVSLDLPYRRLLNFPFTFLEPGASSAMTNLMYVTPGFFTTLQIPIRAGRDVSETDRAGSLPVAVVNETFARSWPAASQIGRRFTLGSNVPWQIVGVVGDVQVTNAGIDFPGARPGPLMTSPVVFIPAAQTTDGFLQLVHTWFRPAIAVRTAGGVNAAEALQRALARADPLLPVQDVQSLSAVEAAATAPQRLLMTLVTVLAAAALFLSAIGIHGLIAHNVAERKREFGIRVALGATRWATVGSVAFSGLALAAVGAAAGAGLAWMAVGVFESFSFLFHVDKHDPATFAVVAIFLLLVSGVASVLPALKLLKLDPAETLRS